MPNKSFLDLFKKPTAGDNLTPQPSYQPPAEEKPWPIYVFVGYVVFLAVIWLVAYPVISAIYDGIVEPLDIPGYLDLLIKSFPWILFLGLLWIGFRKTFKGGV